MEFIGEHLFPGDLGRFCTVLSLAASLVATIAFFKAAQARNPEDSDSWKRVGRVAFGVDVMAVITVIGTIYLMISRHYYEYTYVWNHSSNDVQVKYLLSGFWEGSEGSFLLWTFWQCVLGIVLMGTAKRWEARVMTVLSFAQFCLASMILGLFVFHAKVGSSPFLLMRKEFPDAPFLSTPNYMQSAAMQDGKGLNPLLQNYWMVIHPPILFLGFASTIVPFAYAISALWKRDYKDWIKPVLPWALFSAAILGTGIMMGARWAYESLSFGGYWAWDPVENASLVPWIVMVCGIHTLLAFKHTGQSLRVTFAFFTLSFLLILYSTFLTRSGILGDTSVHSFTDLGMNTQLLVFLLIFVVPSLVLVGIRWKKVPTVRKEEEVSSREFWMFVGSLLLFLSALYISGFTSLPVYNKVFNKNVATPEDAAYAYNKVMILVAIVIGVLTAMTQYLKYKSTTWQYLLRRIGVPTVIALAAAIVVAQGVDYMKYGRGYLIAIDLALFAGFYGIVANLTYIWVGVRGKLLYSGASVAHVGFGMILVGILISSSGKKVISQNTSGITVPGLVDPKGKPENPYENLTLVKGTSFPMQDYEVTYEGDSAGGKLDSKRYYRLHFTRTDPITHAKLEDFVIYPDAFINPKGQDKQGLLANPAARHYWNKDVFLYLTSLPDQQATEDTSTFQNHTLKPGDSLYFNTGFLVLNKVEKGTSRAGIPVAPGDTVLTADVTVCSRDSLYYKARPAVLLHQGQIEDYPDTVVAQSLVLRIAGAKAGKGITLGVKESNAVLDFVTVKAYVFPAINVLWLGVIVMVIGMGMAITRRVRLG